MALLKRAEDEHHLSALEEALKKPLIRLRVSFFLLSLSFNAACRLSTVVALPA